MTQHGSNRFWRDTPAAWEIYDLTQDPHEMHNRYAEPDYQDVIGSLKRDLRELRQEVGDTDQGHARIRQVIEAHWDQ